MNYTGVRPSDNLWKEGAGYYTQQAEELRRQPLLPDFRLLRDRRMLGLFERHGHVTAGSPVLEVGCGGSAWLPFLAREMKCSVFGIDIEPYAAELARANLEGAGVKGEVFCRDAFNLGANEDLRDRFDLVYSVGVIEHFDDAADRLAALAKYLKRDGRILTTVPNMRAVNWMLQQVGGDRERFEMHVIYDSKRLAQVHEAAGFETIAAGYAGFFDGYLTTAEGTPGQFRRRLHRWLCWALSMGAAAWVRAGHGAATPELSWVAPYVFCVGRRVSS